MADGTIGAIVAFVRRTIVKRLDQFVGIHVTSEACHCECDVQDGLFTKYQEFGKETVRLGT